MKTIDEICRTGSFDYYSEVGSYRGAVRIKGKWVSVKNLNYIKKTGWNRLQGPAPSKVAKAMDEAPICATVLFPSLVNS